MHFDDFDILEVAEIRNDQRLHATGFFRFLGGRREYGRITCRRMLDGRCNDDGIANGNVEPADDIAGVDECLRPTRSEIR